MILLLTVSLITAGISCPRPIVQADCSISNQVCTWEPEDEAKIDYWHGQCRRFGPNKCARVITKSQINPTLYGVVCVNAGEGK